MAVEVLQTGRIGGEFVPEQTTVFTAIVHESPGEPFGKVGGAAQTALSLAETFPAYGTGSILVAPNPLPPTHRTQGVEVRTFDLPRRELPTTERTPNDSLCETYGTPDWRQAFTHLFRGNGGTEVAIFHYYDSLHPMQQLQFEARLKQRNMTTLIEPHSLGELTERDAGRSLTEYRRLAELRMVQAADGIVFGTQFELEDYAEHLRQRYGQELGNRVFEKSLAVPLGVNEQVHNLELRLQERSPMREKYLGTEVTSGEKTYTFKENLAGDDTVAVISVARVEKLKGQKLGVRAAAELLVENSDMNVVFVFVGDPTTGSYYDEAQAEIGTIVNDLPIEEQERVKDRIRFIGSQPGYEVMRAADIYLAPSYSESFNLTLAEALRQGLPVAASDLGPHKEVAGHAPVEFFESGNYLALKHALKILIENPRMRKETGALNHERGQELTWHRSVEHLFRQMNRLKVAA